MARRAFYSFHYELDNMRAARVRNMGVIEGDAPCSDNDWEAVKRGGDAAIERWIARQLDGRSTTIVLIGAETAGRPWITHEIMESWNKGMALLGIHVHNLLDWQGRRAIKGGNPFDHVTLGDGAIRLSSIVPVYDPPFWDSSQVYKHIAANLGDWIEHAHGIRKVA
ncbi:MAG: TIR domain-containing protein [Pseudomonadota bacterium]